MKTKKKFVPAQCSFDQLCRLRRDHLDIGDFSIMTDGHTVWLTQQVVGEKPKQKFEITRALFNRLTRWYHCPQAVVRK